MSDPIAYISDPFGGRSVKEWIGKTPDAKVPDIVRSRVFARAGGRCHLSGIKIVGKPWQIEHVKPLSMGGQHRESNMAPALAEAHQQKTSEEADARSKADRIRRKREGTWPKTRFPLKSRGFPKRSENYR